MGRKPNVDVHFPLLNTTIFIKNYAKYYSNVIVWSSIENFLHSFWSRDCLWIKPVYFQKINNNKNNYDLVNYKNYYF